MVEEGVEDVIVPAGPSESGSDSGAGPYNRSVAPFMLNRVILALCWLGFFVAGVLSISSLFGLSVPCGTSMGCETVANHPTSKLFGSIPVAYLGLAGYLILAIVATLRAQASGEQWRKLSLAGLVLSGLGAGYSFYLTYVSLSIIHARCNWCLTSALTMIVLFLLHGVLHHLGAPAEPAKPKLDFLIAGTGLLLALGLIGFQMQRMQKSIDWATDGVNFNLVTESDIIPEAAKVRGPENAKVTIIEFADINCPACRRAVPDLKDILNQHNGKIKMAFRHIPLHMLPGHETSIEAAMIAEYAATKGKFWEFMDLAFDSTNDQRIKSVNGLFTIAEEAGLDRNEIQKLVTKMDDALLDRVNRDMVLGTQSMAILSTPTFIVLAEGAPPKAVSINRLAGVLEQEPYASLLK